MIYVMSDIHGCYEKYMQMLKKINFSSDDTLYILGDVIDRGEKGIEILLDMMKRENVFPILGNHEFMAYRVLKNLNVEITEENFDSYLTDEMMQMYETWIYNGGNTTCREFLSLDKDTRDNVLEYLGEFELYEELRVNGNNFVLVHGGLVDFKEDKDLSQYSLYDMIWGRCDYAREYYSDKFLITGHTPTFHIDEEYRGKMYRKYNHIAIDCGAVFGEKLGCICLDTLEEFYV